jgi:outer membrane protein OmpA-like peptidoglycan-associated protein
MRGRGVLLVLLLGTATPGLAQSAGSFEIQGFGRFTRFDDTLQVQQQAGAGGSLAFFPLSNVSIEGEGAFTNARSYVTGNSVTTIPLRARLTYHVPTGPHSSSLRLGVGYVRNLYRGDAQFDDDGVTGVLGVRLGITDLMGLRLDGTADYVRRPDGGRADNYVNWGAQAGLSLLFGKHSNKTSPARRDADRDGVVDEMDRCPNTAAESVDQTGCSPSQRDEDHDGGETRVVTKPAEESVNTSPLGHTTVLLKLTFRYGRGTLNPKIRAILLGLAQQLIEHPEYRVQISGYTDGIGSRAANLRLSLARARTVETFLVGYGVPGRQLRSQGFGRDVPVATNRTAAGRAKNRRVELVVTQ